MGKKLGLQGRLVPFLSISFHVSDEKKTITNRQTGWMLRTKLSHVDEGGVAAGLGALDSILLVDAEGCCADVDGNPCLPACVPNPDFAATEYDLGKM